MRCGSPRATSRSRPGRRWPQWRCRDCRYEFTAVTGTALHGTRLAPDACLAAEAVASPSTDRSSIATPLGEISEQGTPLRDASRIAVSLMDALRRRPDGATLAKLAVMTRRTERHTRRGIKELERLGLIEQAEIVIPKGHQTVAAKIWRFTYTHECVVALGQMPPMTPLPSAERGCGPGADDTVPPRFWGQFWSGASGPELRVSQHGVHIGGTLIGCRDIGACCWALRRLRTDDLAALRTMRGHDSGINARMIDAELERRSLAAA